MLRLTVLAVLVGCDPGAEVAPRSEPLVGVVVPENPAIVGGLGSACRADADCADPDLDCDLTVPGGLCSAACDDGAARQEQAQCFDDPDATCLAQREGGLGRCTPACEAVSRAGGRSDCLDNQACTSLWWTRLPEPPDTPGCQPWCTDDVPCAPYMECFDRMGTCVPLASIPSADLKPDGEPCSLGARNDSGFSTDCRGDCFFVLDPASGEGICGSYIHRRITESCPDRPREMRAMGLLTDDIALCLFRDCATEKDCTAPLVCGECPHGGSCCVYPEPDGG